MKLRMSEYEEIMGADFVEHGIHQDLAWGGPLARHARKDNNGRRRSSFGIVRNVSPMNRLNEHNGNTNHDISHGVINKGAVFTDSEGELNAVAVI